MFNIILCMIMFTLNASVLNASVLPKCRISLLSGSTVMQRGIVLHLGRDLTSMLAIR